MTEAGDRIGAFLPGAAVKVAGAGSGPLHGLTFAAKDLFDVAGHPTGAGSPDWPRSRALPERHAWAVQQLLDAGCDLAGKTVTDEISLGILGESAFHGVPVNVRAPGRVPGGSSSGSAAAVATGLVDTALGTDTGGSVRVPASFCGLFGIRPTHGRLPLDGMAPQAPSSDTTGWFARDPATFKRVSAVLLGEAIPLAPKPRLTVAWDAFGIADTAVAAALQPLVERLAALAGAAEDGQLAPQGLSEWARAQRSLQPYEAWKTFEGWVERFNPRMTFTVARGLIGGANIPAEDRKWAALLRADVRARMAWLTRDGGMVCLPTTPFPAPPIGLSVSAMDVYKDRITCLAAVGGLAGHPQVNLPGATVDGLPVGLSIIGARGQDAQVVAFAAAMAQEQA